MRRSKQIRRPVPIPRDPAQDEVRADVARRFPADGKSWHWVGLCAESFFVELPTPAERAVFAEIHSADFLETFGFITSEYDQYPASVERATGSCVFRRPYAFFQKHQARAPFDPPDLRNVPYRDLHVTMARARAEWWQANNWEMSKEESRWLEAGGPPQPESSKVRQFEKPKGEATDGRTD